MEPRTLHDASVLPVPEPDPGIEDVLAVASGREGQAPLCPRCGGPARQPVVLAHGALRLDRDRRAAALDGRAVPLTRAEFDLLWHIAARRGRLATYAWLGRLAAKRRRAPGFVATPAALKVLAHRVRRRLGAPALIETVAGEGFRLGPPAAIPSLDCGGAP